MIAMNRYSSTYFNSERYFDPTAGKALVNLIREENRKFKKEVVSTEESNLDEKFAEEFSKFYDETFGRKSNGKLKRFARYNVVRDHLKIYNYCMKHVNEESFTIEKVVDVLNLGTDTKVKQVFTGSGQISKLVACYKEWLNTRNIRWNMNLDKED